MEYHQDIAGLNSYNDAMSESKTLSPVNQWPWPIMSFCELGLASKCVIPSLTQCFRGTICAPSPPVWQLLRHRTVRFWVGTRLANDQTGRKWGVTVKACLVVFSKTVICKNELERIIIIIIIDPIQSMLFSFYSIIYAVSIAQNVPKVQGSA